MRESILKGSLCTVQTNAVRSNAPKKKYSVDINVDNRTYIKKKATVPTLHLGTPCLGCHSRENPWPAILVQRRINCSISFLVIFFVAVARTVLFLSCAIFVVQGQTLLQDTWSP